MTTTLMVTLEPPPGALEDDSPTHWTAGYVAGALRASGVVVHECRLAIPGHVEPRQQVRERRAVLTEVDRSAPPGAEPLDLGPGVASALDRAAAELAEMDAGIDEPDPRPFHALLVENAQMERRPFDADAARARAGDGI